MQDFIFNDDCPDDQRAPYRLILWRLLDNYHILCRSKIRTFYFSKQKGIPNWHIGEHEIGWAYNEVEYSFERPIEQLMLQVAAMILNGGRSFESKVFIDFYKEKIKEILDFNDLKTMVDALPKEEKELFMEDLRLLSVKIDAFSVLFN